MLKANANTTEIQTEARSIEDQIKAHNMQGAMDALQKDAGVLDPLKMKSLLDEVRKQNESDRNTNGLLPSFTLTDEKTFWGYDTGKTRATIHDNYITKAMDGGAKATAEKMTGDAGKKLDNK